MRGIVWVAVAAGALACGRRDAGGPTIAPRPEGAADRMVQITGTVMLVAIHQDDLPGDAEGAAGRAPRPALVVKTTWGGRPVDAACAFDRGGGEAWYRGLEPGDEITLRGTLDVETPAALRLSACAYAAHRPRPRRRPMRPRPVVPRLPGV